MSEEGSGPFSATSSRRQRGACDIRSRSHRASTHKGHNNKRRQHLRRNTYHAKKFISALMNDTDPPSLAIRNTWSAVQSVLRRHFPTTTHSSSHVTPSHSVPFPFSHHPPLHLAAFRNLCVSLRTPPCLTTHVWPVAMCHLGVAVLVVVIVADHPSLARSAGCSTRCPVVQLAGLSDLTPPRR